MYLGAAGMKGLTHNSYVHNSSTGVVTIYKNIMVKYIKIITSAWSLPDVFVLVTQKHNMQRLRVL